MSKPLPPEIEHLVRIERFIASISHLDSLLSVIMRETTVATGAESCSLALYDEAADELSFCVARGEAEERSFERELKRIRVPMGRGVVGWCAQRRQIANVKDVHSDPRFDREADRATRFVTRSILAVPMVRPHRLVGVVEAVNKREQDGFTEHDERVLSVLAAQAALVIDNAQLYEQNLQRARLAALGEGIAGAAHCIRNILQGVMGGEYILNLGLRDKDLEKIRYGWDILRRNSGVMKDLVMDMLSYSRSRHPEYEQCDVNEICMQVADLMREKAREKQVELSVALAEDVGDIVCDPNGIYRCVLNLVGNAVDACGKDKGKVDITTRKATDHKVCHILVSDNGCGIGSETLKQLFRPFFSTKGSQGTGLGLAVTQKIIHEHDGEIHVESEVGVGTTFTILLPLCPTVCEPNS